MKAFEAVHRRNPSLGILGIATNDDRSAALAFARKVGISYPLAFDPDGATAQRFGAVGLPSTVFIDARGTLLQRRLGEMTEKVSVAP
jgi:peroxiredoxin